MRSVPSGWQNCGIRTLRGWSSWSAAGYLAVILGSRRVFPTASSWGAPSPSAPSAPCPVRARWTLRTSNRPFVRLFILSLDGSGALAFIRLLLAAARCAALSSTGTLETMTKYSTRRRDASPEGTRSSAGGTNGAASAAGGREAGRSPPAAVAAASAVDAAVADVPTLGDSAFGGRGSSSAGAGVSAALGVTRPARPLTEFVRRALLSALSSSSRRVNTKDESFSSISSERICWIVMVVTAAGDDGGSSPDMCQYIL
mmetsp:Transcript_17109/g.37811  ORF Transcript_17109/g.37811 Transcript_17109/m.37811 type:complete len:257 (+) Transcript_17109:2032-2802(+)